MQMNVGDSVSVAVMILPRNASNKTLQWTSSAPEVADVSDQGKISANQTGKCTITCETTDGSNLSQMFSVEVTSKYEISLEKVKVVPTASAPRRYM